MLKTRGFTLLEMLVVIGIIAVLVSMGFASYSTAQKKARDAKRKLELANIRNAMEQYYSLCNGTYPLTDGGKVPNAISTVGNGCSSDVDIMPVVPWDPKEPTNDLKRYDYDDGAVPPSLCSNNMESEGVFCVYLQQ